MNVEDSIAGIQKLLNITPDTGVDNGIIECFYTIIESLKISPEENDESKGENDESKGEIQDYNEILDQKVKNIKEYLSNEFIIFEQYFEIIVFINSLPIPDEIEFLETILEDVKENVSFRIKSSEFIFLIENVKDYLKKILNSKNIKNGELLNRLSTLGVPKKFLNDIEIFELKDKTVVLSSNGVSKILDELDNLIRFLNDDTEIFKNKWIFLLGDISKILNDDDQKILVNILVTYLSYIIDND